MAESKGTKSGQVAIWIDWNKSAQEKSIEHSNQVIVQTVEHEVNLTFYQYSPPVFLSGTDQETARQLRGIESIVPECVARVNLSARSAQGLIKAIQRQFDENGNLKGDVDEETASEK